jgi:D-tagatose-1,6-bisphosphate aldolase subunit GatZ/KbaZ
MPPSSAAPDIRCLRSDHLEGRRGGLVSICSARREVLESVFELLKQGDSVLLVEATSNQVNQFGGYTGMTPEAFARHVRGLAVACAFPAERLLLGADHLGPYAWRGEPSGSAMAKAVDLVRRFVSAGYAKIHLDAGVGCAGDPGPDLPAEIAAERAALLCRAAEDAAGQAGGRRSAPLYVIGAEVPPPGGGLEDADHVAVTGVERVSRTLHETGMRFRKQGLQSAWERVLAVVVQPGVEFGDEIVARYRPGKASALSAFHEKLPGMMTYEAHSTDYQPAESLKQMVRDHFTLLKVGPCLTHAFGEAALDLERVETEFLKGRRGIRPSRLRETLEEVMTRNPAHWAGHYRGAPERLRFLRLHSLRDRVRYYWGEPEVEEALSRLVENLRRRVSVEIVRRFFPGLVDGPGAGEFSTDPSGLIRRRIQSALKPYVDACR